MYSFRRMTALTACAAVCCSMLSGCTTGGGNNDESSGSGAQTDGTSAPAAAQGEETELVIWESTDGPDRWIEQAGAKFTDLNPNITIKFVNVELGDTASAIALDGPGGTGPDLFAAPHDKLGELVVGGHVLPSDAAAVGEKALSSCVDALTYDGVLYGYPAAAETYALYYNRALIKEDEVPKTWDELITWTNAFNADNPNKYGFVMDVTTMYYTVIFTTANGNRLFGADGQDTSSSYLNTPDAVKGMKLFQSLKPVMRNVASADLATDTADGAFAAGNAAMHISGPWNISNFESAGIDFGVTVLPSLPGDDTPAAAFSGTRGMFVSAYSDNTEEAAAFAKFLMTDEMQQLRYEITGALPAIDIEVNSEYAQGFIDQLEYSFPMPSVPAMSAFWEASESASSNIFDGADVQKELDALDAAIISYVSE